MSGGIRSFGAPPTEQLGTTSLELPLTGLGDGFVLRPVENCAAADCEETGKLGVGFQAEELLNGGFGHVHASESSSLDYEVKRSRPHSVYFSSHMDTMAERVKRAMALRGMTAPDLIARKVLSKAGIYFILDGTTKAEKIRAATVAKLSAALQVNAEWLQYGRGPMEGNVQTPATEGEWEDVRGYAQAMGLGGGPEAAEYAETHKLKFKASSLARKRLRAPALAVMYGKGDSMEPRVLSGDAILFDTSDTRPRDGALFVILVPGAHNPEYQVKRCELLDDLVYFKADNPHGDHNWKKARRMDDKKNPIQIIGRVRWIGSWED